MIKRGGQYLSLFSKNITSIDLGSYETKIVQGSKGKDEIKINKAFSFITPDNAYENGYIRDEFKLSEAIKGELRKNGIRGGICHTTINSTAIIIRELQFPNLSEKELEGLLRFQLGEYLPMDFSKYVIQHKTVDKVQDTGQDKLNVLVVAIPKEIVDAHYNLVKSLGMKPEALDLHSNGAWKFLRHCGNINGSLIPEEKTIAAIDLGYDSTNVTIVKKGSARLNRVIDSGGASLDRNISKLVSPESSDLLTYKQRIADISEVDEGYSEQNRYTNIAKTSVENIMDKIDKVFKYYASKELDGKLDSILLYGGLSKIKGIEKLFSGYFNIPATVLVSAGKIRINGELNKYVSCIGVLIRDEGA